MRREIQKISALLIASAFCLVIPTSILAAPVNGVLMDESDDLPTQSPSPIPISVKCENLATVAYQGDASAKIFHWKTNEFGGNFGGNFTREERCELVSARFDKAIQENNGSFQGLRLTYGPINDRVAICVLKPGEMDCTTSNMLLILKRSDQSNADRVLLQFMQIADPRPRIGIIEGDEGRTIEVNLANWAEKNLRLKPNNSPEKP